MSDRLRTDLRHTNEWYRRQVEKDDAEERRIEARYQEWLALPEVDTAAFAHDEDLHPIDARDVRY